MIAARNNPTQNARNWGSRFETKCPARKFVRSELFARLYSLINSKFEYLNPKQYQNSNLQNSKFCFEHLSFGHSNLFRISDLVFRAFYYFRSSLTTAARTSAGNQYLMRISALPCKLIIRRLPSWWNSVLAASKELHSVDSLGILLVKTSLGSFSTPDTST